MTAPSEPRISVSRAASGRVLIPVLVGLVLGLLILIFMQGGWGPVGGDPSVVGPGADAAQLPIALPEGVDPSQVEVLVLPPPPSPEDGDAAAGELSAGATTPVNLGGTLLVHVLWGDDGLPAADVGVRVIVGADARRRPREATTDAAGNARFEGLPPGNVSVSADRGGSEHADLVEGELAMVQIAIPAGPWVHGVVLDPDGLPCAGADIWLSGYGTVTEGRVVTRSDGDGHWSIRSVSGGHFVGAFAPGRWGPAELVHLQETETDRLDVELQLVREAGAVSVTVTNGDGAPIPAAEVLLGGQYGFERPRTSTTGGTIGLVPPMRASTDAKGATSFSNVPLGDTELVVLSDGFAFLSQPLTVTAGEALELTVSLQRAARLSGRVVTAGDEAVGVPGARVLVTRRDPPIRDGDLGYTETTSGADGSWTLPCTLTGEVTLAASHDDFGGAERRLDVGAGKEFVDLVLTVSRGLEITGTITDEFGSPLQDWIVQVERSTDYDRWRGQAVSDAVGAFTVINCREGAHRLVVLEPESRSVVPVLMVDDVHPSDEPLALVVPADALASAEIRFSLVDSSGAPISDASMQLWSDRGPVGVIAGDVPGSYRSHPLPPDTWTLRVWPGDRPGLVKGDLVVGPREVLDLGALTVPDGGRVHVVASRPPAFEDAELWTIFTDEVGQWCGNLHQVEDGWLSDAMDPGRYFVSVYGSGIVSGRQPVDILAGTTAELHVELEAAVFHLVEVSGIAESRAVAAAKQELLGLRALRFEVDDAAGRTVVQRLEPIDGRAQPGQPSTYGLQAPPGDYHVRLLADEVVVAEGDVSLVEGAPQGVTRLEAVR